MNVEAKMREQRRHLKQEEKRRRKEERRLAKAARAKENIEAANSQKLA